MIHILLALLLDKPFQNALLLEGPYENVDYLYTVDIPAGVQGVGVEPPAPNHGFVLWPPEMPGLTIAVDASYNAALLGSLHDVAASHFPPLGLTPSRVRRVSVSRTSMGGRRALHVIITESNTTEEGVFVLRPIPGEVGIIYSISLKGPLKARKRAQPYFRHLWHTFRLLKRGAA